MGIVRLLCSDALTIKPCRLGLASTKCTFWRLFSGEGISHEGLMSGLLSPQAPKAVRWVFPSCVMPHVAAMRDPIEEVIDSAALAMQRRGAPKPWALETLAFLHGLGLG